MPYISDQDYDLLLSSINADAEALHICSQEPTTYTQAAVTYTLGNKTPPSVAAPTDRSPNGREVVVAAISDGTVTGSGTATHWAIVRNTATARLVATGALGTPQAVTSGNTFSLTQFAIGIPDAV